LNRFRKKMEDLLSAATFAEAGEFETARELARGSKKVLLVLTGNNTDSKSFTYAMSVARRIEAGLEILYFSNRKPGDDLLAYFRNLLEQNGIEFDLKRVSGCMKAKILEYTTKRSDIQFIVAESIEVLNDDCQQESRSLRGTLKRLSCPLVLVSELEEA
jgi:hypothetical protein